MLEPLGAPFAAVDILPDPRIRQELSAISDWPTIPQLFLKGELVGGCDIVTEMYESGELAEALGVDDAGGRRCGGRADRRAAAADREPPVLRHQRSEPVAGDCRASTCSSGGRPDPSPGRPPFTAR